jgi:LysM repeat protein
MKLSSLTVKRRPVKKGGFRTYFANVVRSKKHRAATAAAPVPEVDGDVPNLGIARALVVILVIHVVAIAGIFAHSHWFEEPQQEAAALAAKSEIQPVKALPDAATPLPQVSEDDGIHIVRAGDTYASIAAANGVKEEDLRKANDNIELRASRILRMPARQIVAIESDELRRLGDGSVVHETEVVPVDPLREAPPMVETAAASQAVLVKPAVARRTTASSEAANFEPRSTMSTEVEEAPRARNAAKYTVKQGDTFWKIANAHKTTPAALMKANRINDPKKLKVGMQLLVP